MLPPSAVWCLETSSNVASEVALFAIADILTLATTSVYSASPESSRWKVDEVLDALRPLSLVSSERTAVGVWAAHMMDPACYDRMLKICEEPPGPTLVCLSAPSVLELPTTVRSRISRTIRVETQLPDDIDVMVVELGLHPLLATESRFGEVVSLLHSVAERYSTIWSLQPAIAAAEMLALARDAARTASLPPPAVRRYVAATVEMFLAHAHLCCADHVAAGLPVHDDALDALSNMSYALSRALPLHGFVTQVFATTPVQRPTLTHTL